MAGSRALRRLVWLVGALGAMWLLSGCHEGPHSFVVNTTVDGVDAVPGDQVCEMTPGVGDCSLRAAIDEANADSNITGIELPEGVYELSVVGSEDDNAAGDLDVGALSGDLTIVGQDDGAVIDAAGADGGVDVRSGRLGLIRVAVRGASGHGVTARSGATFGPGHSAIHGNGGDGVVLEAGSTLQMLHTTVSGNGGAGVRNDGSALAGWATIVDNGGGGVAGANATTLGESVVADQAVGADCVVPVVSNGHNSDSDGSCGLAGTGDVSAGVIGLEALSADLVPFHHPQLGSALVDSVPMVQGCGSGFQTHDQRLMSRPVGSSCDRGAIEADFSLDLVVDTAADAPDVAPGDGVCDIGDGSCSIRAAISETNVRANATDNHITLTADPVLSLTGTPEDLNQRGDLDVRRAVTIDGAGHTIDANGIDRVLHVSNGATAVLVLERVSITGGSAPAGGGILIDTSSRVVMRESTIHDNEATGLDQCQPTVSGGIFPSIAGLICGANGGGGGAILAAKYSELEIDRSSIVRNRLRSTTPSAAWCSAPETVVNLNPFTAGSTENLCYYGMGSGLLSLGDTVVSNSTIAENEIEEFGGGAGVAVFDGSFEAVFTTIADNDIAGHLLFGPAVSCTTNIAACPGWERAASTVWASKWPVPGEVLLLNFEASIISGDGVDGPYLERLCYALVPALTGYNVIADDSCGPGEPTDLFAADPLLGPLADNGGPTQTHLPSVGSPVIGYIPAGAGGLCDGSIMVDQRGVARPQGSACDAGSVEQ